MARKKKQKVRSLFEAEVIKTLDKLKILHTYESMKIKYIEKPHIYTPDIILSNGIIIELKGYFKAKDRNKHLLIKDQHPELDIRFVFQRAANKIHKKSPTTYGAWCDKHGFKWADKEIPKDWF